MFGEHARRDGGRRRRAEYSIDSDTVLDRAPRDDSPRPTGFAASHPDAPITRGNIRCALPQGEKVSALIRERLPHVDGREDPDDALFRWIEAEAAMYRGWEDRKIAKRLRDGFVDSVGDPDVAVFRQFSMSIRQSRVSRAGGALQYHFRELLELAHIPFVMEPEIDGGEVPDFLFPSKQAYEDTDFPESKLRMLAAKFTAKDRWRQVLNEARRIRSKHLLTMEAGISVKQRRLMKDALLTLVLPKAVRDKYGADDQPDIMTVRSFLVHLKEVNAI